MNRGLYGFPGTGFTGNGATLVAENRTTGRVITAADHGKLITITGGSFTQAFLPVSAYPPGFNVYYQSRTSGNITIQNTDDLLSWTLYTNECRLFYIDRGVIRSLVIVPMNKRFTSTEMFTHPPGYNNLVVTPVGGCGGGGGPSVAGHQNRGGGGASGIALEHYVPCVPGTQELITIGAGGAPGNSSGVVGGTGGSTSFGNRPAAVGGLGGNRASLNDPSITPTAAGGTAPATTYPFTLLYEAGAAGGTAAAGGLGGWNYISNTRGGAGGYSIMPGNDSYEVVVPTGATSGLVKLWGAGGCGNGNTAIQAGTPIPGYGGSGGFATGTLAVTAGETLSFIIGTPTGGGGTRHPEGDFNYGGAGPGGGRTAIRRGSTELATAGAGGGGGSPKNTSFSGNSNGANGGSGGGSTGGTAGVQSSSQIAATGGTQSAGGTGGKGFNNGEFGGIGGNGSQFTGGNGVNLGGGGGGSGYYGGGGGYDEHTAATVDYGGGGGGGGSSYIGGLTSASTIAGGDWGAPGGYTDPDYVAGVGLGGNYTGTTTSGTIKKGGYGAISVLWSTGLKQYFGPTVVLATAGDSGCVIITGA